MAPPLVSCFWCERIHPGEHPLSICASCAERFLTRRSLDMDGSYALDDAVIDDVIKRAGPGNYALGYLDDGAFHVLYVGRSDSDVRQRLHDWVGMPSEHALYASPAKAPWGGRRRGCLPFASPAWGRVASSDTSYTRFAYSYAPSAAAAFVKECRNYDDLGGCRGLDNAVRPQPPQAA